MNKQIEAGIKLLDELVPAWRGRIDVLRLDINSARNCILGQLFGTFFSGVITLRSLGAKGNTFEYGF